MLVSVLLAQFTVVSSIGALNVALPSIRDDLGASPAELQWMVVLFQISYATNLVVGGKLGDQFGRRRLLLVGLFGFGLVSVGGALAPTASFLLATRLLQGVFGGLVSPQVLAVIQVEYRSGQRSKVLGAFGLVSSAGFVIGQLGTGLVISVNMFGIEWRTVFLLSAFMSAGLVALALTFIKESKGKAGQRVDTLGILALTAACMFLLYPLIQGQASGWPIHFLGYIALAALVTIGFVSYEGRLQRRGRDPLVDLRLFRLSSFRQGLVSSMLLDFISFAPFFILTLTLQMGFGFDPLKTALTTTAAPISTTLMSLIAPRLMERYGALVFFFGGVLSIFATAFVVGSLLTAPTPPTPLYLIPSLFVLGSIGGLVRPACVAMTLGDVPPSRGSGAAGVLQTGQQLAGAIGVACFSSIFFTVLGADPDTSAYRPAVVWSMVPAFAVSLIMVHIGIRFYRQGAVSFG